MRRKDYEDPCPGHNGNTERSLIPDRVTKDPTHLRAQNKKKKDQVKRKKKETGKERQNSN